MEIGIIGAIGVDDIGDVTMLEATLKEISEICKSKKADVHFTVFALNKNKAKVQIGRLGIDADVTASLDNNTIPEEIYNLSFVELRKRDFSNLLENKPYYKEFKKCDALFFIGGGYFNKYWGNRLVLNFIIPIVLGYQLKKPIFISGINLGPFNNEQISKYKGLFKNINTLILRDRDISLDILAKLGGVNGDIILGADDILPAWYKKKKYNNEKLASLIKEPYIVVQLHHWVEKYSDNYINFYKSLAKFLNYLIENESIKKIYFMPFTYYRGADYECGRRLKTFLNDRDEYEVLEPTSDHIFMRELISGSKLVIASRYHPIVFGLGEIVQSLGIYVNDLYKQKISGAYDVVNIDAKNHMLYVKEISYNKLVEKYKQSISYISKNDTEEVVKNYANNRKKRISGFLKNVLT